MSTLVTIGDFSRMTHLSVKALRHYHDVGLLEPAEVDRWSGYRRYDTTQVAVAQFIRRFRDLGLPVDDVKAVLGAPDGDTRNQIIAAHLERMEEQLEQTRSTVASLRRVLEARSSAVPVSYRSVPPTTALAIRASVAVSEFEPWWVEAFQELHAALAAGALARSGPDAALYPGDFFELECAEVTAYVPLGGSAAGTALPGRTELVEVPGAELAVLLHAGGLEDMDQTYGALGIHVVERGLGVDGPIREQYLVSPLDVEDPGEYRTEICWPIAGAVGD
jgi:DNA-binding transcriptional MerR regulator